MADIKICAACVHSYALEDQPKYRRCDLSVAEPRADAALCGEMRKAPCGPDGSLWEEKVTPMMAAAALLGTKNVP